MARKDGGESEGIVLYPSRSPSLGWKPTPLAPLVRGAFLPCASDEGAWKKSPPDKGGQGGCSLDKGFFNNPSSGGLTLKGGVDI